MSPARLRPGVILRLPRASAHLAIGLAARAAILAAAALPTWLALALARLAADVAYALSARRRRIALRNLDIAFRDSLPAPEKRRIARASFRHAMTCLAGLVLRDQRVRAEDLDRVFRISPEEEALFLAPRPRGLAVLSAHVGDWEMGHRYAALRGVALAAVTREISNPWLERQARRLRSIGGSRVIPKRGALLAVRSALRRGEAVGLLADQNCPSRERFFDFLGVPASTYTEHARVLVRARARVLFMACLRDGPGLRFRMVVRDIGSGLPDPPGAPPRERVRLQADELVRRYLRAIEELVRAHPEQYLWLHRRWKSRPTGAPWLYGDLGKPLEPGLLARG